MCGNKSSGTDGIHPRAPKEFKYKIAELELCLKWNQQQGNGRWHVQNSPGSCRPVNLSSAEQIGIYYTKE